MTSTVRWYRYLKPNSENKYPALLDHYNPVANPSLRFVNRSTEYDVREYAAFPTHTELFRYIVEKNDSQCFLHEIPLAQLPQKPRFDIDIDAERVPNFMEFGARLRERLIGRIIDCLAAEGFTLDLKYDLCLYQSHRAEKYSSHIILPYFYHFNRADALAFYEMVVKDDAELKEYVDKRIYDANHSLRCVWCRKEEGSAAKLPEIHFSFRGEAYRHEPKMPYRNDKIKLLRIFEESLITFVTYGQALPSWAPDRPEYQVDDIPRHIADEMIAMLPKALEKAPFVFHGVDGGIVNLRRLQPSFCPLCARVHKKIGTYLTLNNHNGKVHWHCGRCDEKLEVGQIAETKLQEMNAPSYLLALAMSAEKEVGFDREEYEAVIDLLDCIFPEIEEKAAVTTEKPPKQEAPPIEKVKKEKLIFSGIDCILPVAHPHVSLQLVSAPPVKLVPGGRIRVAVSPATRFAQLQHEMIQESLKPKTK